MRDGLEKVDFPQPPALMQSHVELSPDSVQITLPRQGFSPVLLLIAVFGVLSVAAFTALPFVAAHQMREMRREVHGHDVPGGLDGLGYCMLLPAFGLAVVFSSLVIGAAVSQVRVAATPTEVVVQGGLWKTVIATSALEEVRVEGTGGDWMTPCFVMVRSSGRSARFGGNKIRREECEYLAALVKRIVAKT